jgi:polyisoprenyl-phosphate glycosyltransferase
MGGKQPIIPASMLSLVIPVYNNAASLSRLFAEVEALATRIPDDLEVVFVVDGATDESLAILSRHLPSWPLTTQLVELSRNFGSFAAISAGMAHARGDHVAVKTADLQEPPELVVESHRILAAGDAEIVLGARTGRVDPWLSRLLSATFWRLYRRFVVPDMPRGGVDVFACTRAVRDTLLELGEVRTNLIALVLWVGFRRAFVPYERRRRREGRSGWTLDRRLRYALDSIFSFTDLPIRALLLAGSLGIAFSVLSTVTVLVMWLLGRIPALGYTPLMLAVAFFGGLTALGLGIVGQYQWLTLQNSKRRPSYVVRSAAVFDGQAPTAAR